MNLADLQSTMLQALLSPGDEASTGLAQSIDQRANIQGIAIYQHAYVARLIGVLANDHEKLCLFLGEDFDQIARTYIMQNPSKYASLRHFGQAFPSFLATSTHPKAALLAQLCEFERTLLDAYDAPDLPQLTWQQLSSIDPALWPELVFSLQPSLRLFEDKTGAANIWQQVQSGTRPESPHPDAIGAQWVIWRDFDRICQFRTLEPAQFECLQLMLKGESFAAIASALLEHIAQEQLSAALFGWLSQWCEQGMLSAQTLSPIQQSAS